MMLLREMDATTNLLFWGGGDAFRLCPSFAASGPSNKAKGFGVALLAGPRLQTHFKAYLQPRERVCWLQMSSYFC